VATATQTSELAAQATALTEAHRVAQNQRARLVALLVVQWWRTRVDFANPKSVESWLDLMTPRIMAEYERSGAIAQTFYSTLRRLEVPNAPAFTPLPPKAVLEDAIRASLSIVGPSAVTRRLEQYDKMSTAEKDAANLALDRKMVEVQEKQRVETALAGATVRHTLAGGRNSIQQSSERDRTAIGWVRVTKSDPCYFCAMLASRGLESGTYDKDSFAESDGRFVGPGDAKVHDHCGCSLKPVYRTDDEHLLRTQEFEDMWRQWSTGSTKQAILTFRRGYEGRIKAA
jgi:hypothetical protein